MSRRLEGRAVFVTGGSRGLGRAIALAAAREGARVWVGYRRRERDATEALAAIRALGGEGGTIALDVRDPASVSAAIERVLAEAGRIDGVVTSAGITLDGFLAMQSVDELDEVLATNVRGTMLVARAALRPMIAARSGAIVALASVAGLMASPGQSAYAASKGAILAFVRTLAAEVAGQGVRVNALAPGLFDAGMVKAMPRDKRDAALAHVPMKRLGDADELARAALFLLSDDASFVTGQTLVVDGGLSL